MSAQEPDGTHGLDDPHPQDRRKFLQLAAASMALMGVGGCGPEVDPRNREPYVKQPPGILPGGPPRYYASATSLQGFGCGVVLEHRMGRPVKVEGNPDHPASLGATSALGQATLLSLYDPLRAQAISQKGHISTWESLASTLLARRQSWLDHKGQGLAILTGTVTSPTLASQLEALRRDFPELAWVQWDPINRDQVSSGTLQAFGQRADWVPDFSAADLIVAIESDFLESAPGHLRFARQFASRRRAAEVRDRMSRLYALESTPTLAGAKADHRLRLSPVEIEGAFRHLAAACGAGPKDWTLHSGPQLSELNALARELDKSRGRILLHAGASQPAAVHCLVHAINYTLGAIGATTKAIQPVSVEPVEQTRPLAELAQAISRNQVSTLIILGASNPAFTAPADLEFERLLRRVPLSIYLGEYADETAAAVQWHVPQAHEYETWSDVRAFEGTTTLQQPQVRFNSERRSPHELLALLGGETTPDAQTLVRQHWLSQARQRGIADFDAFWTEALRTGVVPETASPSVSVQLRPDFVQTLRAGVGPSETATLLFRPDPFLWDGRFAENAWLQELPRPFTRLTWDNAALIAPRMAQTLRVTTGDLLELSVGDRRIRAPVWILPGQAEGCVTLPLGFGRRTSTPVAAGVGFDPYPLRTQNALWQVPATVIRKVDGRHEFAPIQREARTLGRDLVHQGTLSEFLQNPGFLRTERPDESLFPPYRYEGIAWAMSINLNACIGCQACVAACQAENNSPTVGKQEVIRGREMHWLRIDRYYEGPLEDPRIVFQPVPCMHCENAPCEVVCPVHATVHDSEGLNVMVYNRCVGTRFCSNNCPYKVRRFNFFAYSAAEPRPPDSWNPTVSVRDRGVMEKCTYCIQRTRAAMIAADRDNRKLADGEVMTACQQVCPTQAITFGDRNDARSSVARRKASPLDYAMLDDLNTRPRTTYEALIRNPNPDIGNV